MSVLHIVNKSPFERNSLDACLRLAQADSAILLIEDGIYAAQKGTAVSDRVAAAMAKYQIYALSPDLQARGIGEDRLIDGIKTVDYDGFVQLACDFDKSQSWL